MGIAGIGFPELLLILLIGFLIFGPGKLPEIGRGLGKAVREFKKYSSELTKDFREEFDKEMRNDDTKLKELVQMKTKQDVGKLQSASPAPTPETHSVDEE
jgi:TatA/E family protein of Tat protein translocase